jgi:cell division septum initiation protein DivIVA
MNMSEKYLHEMIDDIEVLIDEAKPARFSPGKIMIEKDVLMTVIEELRKQIPGEILEDARVKSQQMIDQAARDAGELIDQNEVVEMAKMRANEIETHAKDTARSVVHNANEEADQIRAGALRYVNEIMEDVQGYVASVKEAQESVFNQLLSALDSDLASIKTNAKEIEEQLSGVSIPQARTRTVEDFISDED